MQFGALHLLRYSEFFMALLDGYRKDFVREGVHEVRRLILCPTFDFIKNRFKPKSKLKPEPPDRHEGYA
ncbi:MAG: hypothetical protein ACRD4W_05365, partial [Nitrososphaeraceae archaeon]